MRESIPRQVDKMSGVPEEERDLGLSIVVWNSQGGRKHQLSFLSWILPAPHHRCGPLCADEGLTEGK